MIRSCCCSVFMLYIRILLNGYWMDAAASVGDCYSFLHCTDFYWILFKHFLHRIPIRWSLLMSARYQWNDFAAFRFMQKSPRFSNVCSTRWLTVFLNVQIFRSECPYVHNSKAGREKKINIKPTIYYYYYIGLRYDGIFMYRESACK